MGARQIPSGCQFWPDSKPGEEWKPIDVVKMYEAGYAGAWRDDEARERTRHEITASGGYADAIDATRDFQGTGEGKLSLTFPAILKHYPKSLPGPAQARGSCVAHNSKNAALASLCNEVEFGKPDEHTGFVEGAPEISGEGEANGALSTEYLYWWRGYNGDGWDCSTAAEMIRKNGMMVRQNYPELGIDLTRYSGSLEGKYGAKSPPENIAAAGRIHPVRTVTYAKSYEETRDLIANGYGLSSCGGEGFSSTRDENGVSARRGSWSHAMAYLGCDDRQIARDRYKTRGLILVQNSWAIFNSGPRRIMGTTIDIPEGSFWATWEDVKNREVIAYSSLAGWKRKQLPDYGFSYFG